MGCSVRRKPGGILGLLELHEKHSEAIEHDLIALGLRWRDVGSDDFNWRDLLAIVKAATPGTAIYRALSPDGAGWSHTDHLLADLFDSSQQVAYYAAAAVSRRGQVKKPKLRKRPGVDALGRESKTFGMKPMPIPDLIRALGWENRPEVQRGR